MDPGLAGRYADLVGWHWWFRGRAQVLSRVLARELGPVRAPRRIASVGSGPPAGLDWLLPIAGEGGLVVGEDADPTGALRRRPQGRREGRSLVIAAAGRSALREGAFDAVLALDVLEHLDDDAGALSSAARLAKPGGLVLVTVPAGPGLWGLQDVVSGHRRRYTRRTLEVTFARAGLARPRLSYLNGLLFLPIASVRWMRRLLGDRRDARSAPGGDFDDSRPGAVNELLASVFGAERHLVGRLPLPFGVSLLATTRAGGSQESG